VRKTCFDAVHDIQEAYREVLECMARPGRIGSIQYQAQKINIDSNCRSSTLVLALMLLDTEVSFKIFPEQRQNVVSRLFNQLTYSRELCSEKADLIFILEDADSKDFISAVKYAKTGDIVNPHTSATIIIEAISLTEKGGIILSGPGIPKECRVGIESADNWFTIREEKNKEYPMGIDIIFVGPSYEIMCIPRTTVLRCERGMTDGLCSG
jgi:alpha-D-ribose 1-methylphosphonate 5-triphosphate synthase subunit PhnH